jgi:predicted HTH domain antitoxin
MSEAIYLKIPERIKEEADLLVEGGYFDNRSELIREALREYLSGLRGRNLELAVDLYRKGKVSLGKAAELSGLGYEGMKEVLAERKLPIRRGPESAGEAEEEFSRLEKGL